MITGFRESSKAFLEYVEKLAFLIGNKIKILSLVEYSQSLEIEVNGVNTLILSKDMAQKIYVSTNEKY